MKIFVQVQRLYQNVLVLKVLPLVFLSNFFCCDFYRVLVKLDFSSFRSYPILALRLSHMCTLSRSPPSLFSLRSPIEPLTLSGSVTGIGITDIVMALFRRGELCTESALHTTRSILLGLWRFGFLQRNRHQ